MFGLPLLTTEIGTGTSYVNEGGVTGLVVPPGDAYGLRGAMMQLQEDAALCGRMGAAARRRFAEFFTADRMGAEYHRLYREIIAKPEEGSC